MSKSKQSVLKKYVFESIGGGGMLKAVSRQNFRSEITVGL
jgi:hypothetical protein